MAESLGHIAFGENKDIFIVPNGKNGEQTLKENFSKFGVICSFISDQALDRVPETLHPHAKTGGYVIHIDRHQSYLDTETYSKFLQSLKAGETPQHELTMDALSAALHEIGPDMPVKYYLHPDELKEATRRIGGGGKPGAAQSV